MIMRKEKRFLPKKFPADVARFFNPHKSGTNAEIDQNTGIVIRPGTHQFEKWKERNYIPVYSGRGTAHVAYDKKGRKVYV